MRESYLILPVVCGLLAPCAAAAAPAEGAVAEGAEAAETAEATEAPTTGISDIIVTAERRSASINQVPMSITAQTGEQLRQAGIVAVTDLPKIVPSLTISQSPYGTPVYTLRGVGYYDTSIAASSAVAIYLDEVPIPFAIEATGVLHDLERVEVLKGPQGTLFGQNTTGGALNFISAKPTSDLHYGADVSFGRFNDFVGSAYISGPLSNTLTARLSLKTNQSGPWQRSSTRDDELGSKRLTQGRLSLSWEPTENLKLDLAASGWINKSDVPAIQYVLARPSVARVPSPVLTYPFVPTNARDADWDPDQPFRDDNRFGMISLRAELQVADDIQLTSITAYNHFKLENRNDLDGTPFVGNQNLTTGKAHTFYQELRANGTTGNLIWQMGVNFQEDYAFENRAIKVPASTPALGPGFTEYDYGDSQKPTTKAVFGQAEWKFSDQLSVQGGIRYTDSKRVYRYCQQAPNAAIAALYKANSDRLRIAQGLTPSAVINPGDCVTLGADYLPVADYRATLSEDNVSWKVGANWRPSNRILFYANLSRGYKAGSFPQLSASTILQLAPVTQEKVLASEVGFKAGTVDRTLQVNGAIFHYDYRNKQFLGTIADPLGVLGSLRALVNIPRSRLNGAELQIQWQPFEGLTLSGNGTYIDAKVNRTYVNRDALGNTFDFNGLAFPLTPKWSGDADAEYRFPLSSSLEGFVGAHANYSRRNMAAFASPTDPRTPRFLLPSRTLIDLRAGIETDRWRASIWARNITNDYYWTSVFASIDTIGRTPGMPSTYGFDISYRF